MEDLLIIGTGGVGRFLRQAVSDINQQKTTWSIVGYLDENVERYGKNIEDVPILGGLGTIIKYPKGFVVVAVGSPAAKYRLVQRLKELGHTRFATIVHPHVWIGKGASIGQGSIIYPGVTVNIASLIGQHVIVNMNCAIGHDSVIEDFSTLAPGTNIGGATIIRTGCDIGIGSSTIQGTTIGSWSIIGAGSVVIRDIPANVTAVGMPANPIKERPEGWHKE